MANNELIHPSSKEVLILELLSESPEPLFGLELIRRSGGRLKRGTIYVTLQRMETKGFLASERESRIRPEIGIPRRKYQVSDLGERVLKAHHAARAAFSTELAVAGV